MTVVRGFSLPRLFVGLAALSGSYFLLRLAGKADHQIIDHQTGREKPRSLHLQHVQCRQCTADLDSDSLQVVAGVVYVKCEYCGAQYQIDETTKH